MKKKAEKRSSFSVFSVTLFALVLRLFLIQLQINTHSWGTASGVQLAQTNPSDQFHFHRTAFSSMFKSRVGNILVKTASLRINLNLDGTPIGSKPHTHPSHSQTSCLLTSFLSLGVPGSSSTTNPVSPRCVESSFLVLSLSSYRYSCKSSL
jgi:hypothetical protein